MSLRDLDGRRRLAAEEQVDELVEAALDQRNPSEKLRKVLDRFLVLVRHTARSRQKEAATPSEPLTAPVLRLEEYRDHVSVCGERTTGCVDCAKALDFAVRRTYAARIRWRS